MTKTFLELSKSLIDNVENIDDIVDSYFEPVKDLTDTAKDIFTPIKVVHSLFIFNKKRKFKRFLKSYASSLMNSNIKEIIETDRLKAYLKIERNFNFLSSVIESAINSKSIYGSVLLGYFAGLILTQKLQIGFKELIIIEGINALNDIEFSCFARIYHCANLAEEVNIYNYIQLKPYEFICELTISKLIQLRIVSAPEIRASGISKGSFFSTEIAEEIFELMKTTSILDELLLY